MAERPWGHRDFMVADLDGNIVWVTMPLPLGAAEQSAAADGGV